MPRNSCRAQTDERPSMPEGKHFVPDHELQSGPAPGAPPCDKGPANAARRRLQIRSFQFSTQEQGFSCRPEKASYKRTSRNSALLFPNPHRLEEKPAQPKEMSAGCELLVLT